MFKGILSFISYALSSIILVTIDTLCLQNALQIIKLGYQLNSTANPAHLLQNWAKLAVLFSW